MVTYEGFAGKFYKDFLDLKDKVSYLSELGISSFWSTPFLESNSYHNYDCTDFYRIKKELGNLREFKHCLSELHKHNIKFIMDLVICHTSDNHDWFIRSKKGEYPYVNYYRWSDVKRYTTSMDNCEDQSSGVDRWHYCEENGKYYQGEFGSNMPSLNLSNQELQSEIEKIVTYWINIGVDGFRLDAVRHSHDTMSESVCFWNWFREMCKKIKYDIVLVGECWSDANTMANFSNVIGSCFDFEQQGIVLDHINRNDLRSLSFKIKETNDKSRWANQIDSIFLSNHDQDRVATTLGGNIDRLKIASTILLTSKGSPYMYYGEEIGLMGTKINGDIGVRQSMDWDEAVKQAISCDSLLNHYKKLIAIRNSSNALKYGNLSPMWSDSDSCMCFKRSFYNETVVVVVNNKDKAVPEMPRGVYKVLMGNCSSDIIVYNGEYFDKGHYILQLL